MVSLPTYTQASSVGLIDIERHRCRTCGRTEYMAGTNGCHVCRGVVEVVEREAIPGHECLVCLREVDGKDYCSAACARVAALERMLP